MCWENPLVRDFNHSLLYKRQRYSKAPICPLLFNLIHTISIFWKCFGENSIVFLMKLFVAVVLQGRIVSYNLHTTLKKLFKDVRLLKIHYTKWFHLQSCLNKNNYNFNHPLLFRYVDFITQIFLFRDTHLKGKGLWFYGYLADNVHSISQRQSLNWFTLILKELYLFH